MAAAAPSAEHVELERLYRDDPPAYRRRVRRLIWLGYGYIGVCLLVIVGFIGGGVALFASRSLPLGLADEFLQVGIPAVAVAGLMVRAVFVRIPPPEGHYLEGELKRRVVEFFDPVRRSVGGGEIEAVVIVDDLNAAVQQRPKWGLLGPGSNYLIVGAPMFHVMSPEELSAVIAHEFGHLSHEHGRMGATVYRLDHTLRQAAHAIREKAKPGLAEWSFRFFNWFYPRFDTVTFAMRRGQEYEADRAAARATSAEAISSSLCRLHAVGGAWGRYWDGVWSGTRAHARNEDVHPYRELAAGLERFVDRAEAQGAIEAALERDTDFADTHPSLRDRLAALGVDAADGALPAQSALEAIFPPEERAQLLGQLDQRWRSASEASWSEGHERYAEAERERDRLSASQDALSEEELLRLAGLQERLDGSEAAHGTYRVAVERFPESAATHCHWARANVGHDLEAADRNRLITALAPAEVVGFDALQRRP